MSTRNTDYVSEDKLNQAVDAILKGMQSMFDQARRESKEMFDQARKESREMFDQAKKEREKGFRLAKKERKTGFVQAKKERHNGLKQVNKRLDNLEEELHDLKSEIRAVPNRREFNELKDKVRVMAA